jgi:branched-subunit amino acid ABC-type transport system permease component
MVRSLGHDVPKVFTLVFASGTALAGLAGVIGGNYHTTDPSMAFTMGPIVFVVVVFGGLGSLAGCFIASLLMGLLQTFASCSTLRGGPARQFGSRAARHSRAAHVPSPESARCCRTSCWC